MRRWRFAVGAGQTDGLPLALSFGTWGRGMQGGASIPVGV